MQQYLKRIYIAPGAKSYRHGFAHIYFLAKNWRVRGCIITETDFLRLGIHAIPKQFCFVYLNLWLKYYKSYLTSSSSTSSLTETFAISGV